MPHCAPVGDAGLLGEEASDPADHHRECDSRGEQVTGSRLVADDPLGHVDAEPGADQGAQHRRIAVRELVEEVEILRRVQMLGPGAQA